MTDDSEVARIARELPITLQNAMIELSEIPTDKSVTFTVKFGYRLERLGLAKRTLLSDRTYLTPLGLRVRAYLQSQATGTQPDSGAGPTPAEGGSAPGLNSQAARPIGDA